MKKVTLQNVILWLAISLVFAVVCRCCYKTNHMSRSTALTVPFLSFYLCFVSTITLLERVPRRKYRYRLDLFWTYRRIFSGKTDLISEVFWNIVLFIPIGGMLSVLCKKHRWLSLFLGFLLSVGIEVLQLVSKRGLFEFDDILHNTIGTVIGLAVYLGLSEIHCRS